MKMEILLIGSNYEFQCFPQHVRTDMHSCKQVTGRADIKSKVTYLPGQCWDLQVKQISKFPANRPRNQRNEIYSLEILKEM